MNGSRTIPPAVRNKMLWDHAPMFLFMLGALWVLFIVGWVFKIDLLDLFQQKKLPNSPAVMYGSFALVGTPIILIWFYFHMRRAFRLAKFGIATQATILNISQIGRYGMAPVRYQYEFSGQSFSNTVDMVSDSVQEGQEIEILVDPSNPSRSLPLKKVFPSTK